MRTTAATRAPEATTHHVAIVTPDEGVLPEVEEFLAKNFAVSFLHSAPELLPLLAEVPLDAVLLDLDTVGDKPEDGIAALEELRGIDENFILIALTRSKNRSLRLKAGQVADEFFVAPVDFQELQIVLSRALEKRDMEIENRRLREQIVSKYSLGELIGGSEPMRRVYDAITRLAESPTTIIIRGESGTGKELVARALVQFSTRSEKPFISVNCAALPENLIEAELFGHEKGAFTGAHAARAGHIELAHGGTLFLDEIGSLAHSLQSKLLRVLEERNVQRLGGKTPKKVDFRLVTATNDNLEDMVREGRFREDLYYRIHVVPIFLPPLRERPGDIALLVDHFLRIYCAANKLPLKNVEPGVMDVLEDYPWPGNVRELENVVQRLVLMAEGTTITVKHLPQQLLASSSAKQEALLIPEDGLDFDEEMRRIEIAYLQAALRRTEGKKSAASDLLRIDPQKMKYLCRKYRIDVDR
ncbi:MAG: sigma-54-dependent Fis family transcriptional regulator [Candidatus Koribacter versatilis]|uniref:Sigma-54-dependent Fis family transcriptional regulator n=1 Tax=Candidatus Korobacter versatilis TaxID=658062 RepID=A0A932ENP6_9BACT|nr:sigma-54-dependent Fis family transcriptional regulator [Candidatus Koribacter versatilis]